MTEVLARIDLADVLGQVSPWALMTVGVALLVGDALAARTEILGWLGAAILTIGVLLLLGVPASWALYSLPAQLLLWALLARRLLGPQRRERARRNGAACGFEPTGSSLEVLRVNPDRPRRGRGHISGMGEWSFECPNGPEPEPGQRLRVLRREGVLLIAVAQPKSPPDQDAPLGASAPAPSDNETKSP